MAHRERLVPLLRACHPLPTLAVTAYTTTLALGTGRRWGSSAAGAAALAGQLAVGWSNDYLDRGTARPASRCTTPVPPRDD